MRIGTRKSAMALAQTEEVIRQLRAADAAGDFELVKFETRGDRDNVSLLGRHGGKGGAFVGEIREAIRAGELDAAMHSLKDIPGNEETPGLVLGAYLERDDSSDALVLRDDISEDDLAMPGHMIGTASVRRSAFLRRIYPEAEIIHMRGAVSGSERSRLAKLDNRLQQETESGEKVGPPHALVLASSGLMRLGHADRISRPFASDEMIAAAGQGIVVVECRADDFATRSMLARINHAASETCALAEREVLWVLNGHCDSPIAAHAEIVGDELHLNAAVMSLDGTTILRAGAKGPADLPRELGRGVGFDLIAQGADRLIAESAPDEA